MPYNLSKFPLKKDLMSHDIHYILCHVKWLDRESPVGENVRVSVCQQKSAYIYERILCRICLFSTNIIFCICFTFLKNQELQKPNQNCWLYIYCIDYYSGMFPLYRKKYAQKNTYKNGSHEFLYKVRQLLVLWHCMTEAAAVWYVNCLIF